jgi:hypothetical protein
MVAVAGAGHDIQIRLYPHITTVVAGQQTRIFLAPFEVWDTQGLSDEDFLKDRVAQLQACSSPRCLAFLLVDALDPKRKGLCIFPPKKDLMDPFRPPCGARR